MSYRPIILIVLDGFGVSLERRGNAIAEAHTPTFDFLEKRFPFTLLQASGPAVGLPWGEAGNSEVGHLTMGAGRIFYNHLPRVIHSIRDGSFFENSAFLGAIEHIKKHNSKLHLFGLVSSGSVHAYFEHLLALLELAKRRGIKTYLHIITDGKDAPPTEGAHFIQGLEERLRNEFPSVTIATIMGRAFAMDRDDNWDRIKKAYELLTQGRGIPVKSASSYLSDSYQKGVTDESVEPAVVVANSGAPAVIQNSDALIMFNFREDSMREITEALAKEGFERFSRALPQNLFVATMTEYERGLTIHVAFSPLEVHMPLGRVLAEHNLKQLRIAETEKYAHVTYFFNGGNEKPFLNEERVLIASGREKRFDETPEMKAEEVAQKLLENFPAYDFALVNFANLDMVGHTGNFEMLKHAVEKIDEMLGKIVERTLATRALLFITGDHGNAEQKINPITGEKITEHTINPVPFFAVADDIQLKRERAKEEITRLKKEAKGVLADIAPTILDAFGIKKPEEMIGDSLLPLLTRQISL